MGAKIVIIFSLILVSGVVVYLVSSNALENFSNFIPDLNLFPERPTSTRPSTATSTPPSKNQTSTAPTPPPYSTEPKKPPVTAPVSYPKGINPSEIPKGYTIDQLSPFFHKVRISSVSPGTSPKTYTKVTLTARLSAELKSMNITGWILRGKDKSIRVIPRAVETYSPVEPQFLSDIVLKNSETLNLYATSSPIGNFKLNKCIGYFAKIYNFSPALSASCPAIDKTDISFLNSKCQDYIKTLSGCAVPDPNKTGIVGDRDCYDFLSKINYGGCYYEHRGDADFLKSEWRVWLNRPDRANDPFLDPKHDRVELFDRLGLLVDLYIY